MPLRDHFRSPLDDVRSWNGLHGMWPAMNVLHLVKTLPEPYYAIPSVHLGSVLEVDMRNYSDSSDRETVDIALSTYVPQKPTLTLEPVIQNPDTYEVRIYDSRRNRDLVAAIEIVCPSNKDRPEHRESFVANVATLLKNGICVSIVDIVSTMDHNLYADLMHMINGVDPALGDEPPPMYAVTLRTRYEQRRKLMDTWYHPLAIGHSLPTLPIWLREDLAVSLELESSYEECCRALRIR
ncbi:hypothetical protein BH10PLA2_BH10PLA2_07030 [soil metagenome]